MSSKGGKRTAVWVMDDARGQNAGAPMIPVPTGVRVWLATGHTDMRKGFDGLALIVQETLKRDPHSGQLFVFRGRRGQLPTFCIWFSQSADCVPLASAVRPDIAGLAEPARQGSDVHLHG
jgi:transposase